MSPSARHAAADLLDTAADTFSNHGCNDFTLPATPENIAFVHAAELWAGIITPDEAINIQAGTIYTTDFMLMRYCAHLLRREPS